MTLRKKQAAGGNKDETMLICIAFHYAPERYHFLKQVLQRFLNTYKLNINIIIDTNTSKSETLIAHDFKREIDGGHIRIVVHKNMSHPFQLTWCHRKHMKNNINNYDIFMYIEDDIDISYDAFRNYLNNLEILWPDVPSYLRVEKTSDGKLLSSEHSERSVNKKIIKGGKEFIELNVTYNATWCLPRDKLKPTIGHGFDLKTYKAEDHHRYRETAASYPTWQLHKKGYVEFNGNRPSDLTFIYHLPNNYINTSPPRLSIDGLLKTDIS